MSVTADTTLLWRAGKLKYKLHSDQRVVYDHFNSWRANLVSQRRSETKLKGKYPRVYVVDCSRRWGKDYFGLDIMIEVALRKKNATLTYATAYQKDIGDIINSPDLFKKLTEDAPADCKPVYRDSYRGQAQGLYFPNGSVIKLVGIDLNPDALRGRGSDGICISEAAFCSDLDKTVETVLLPQFMGRDDAFLIMNSTPPEAGGHPWDAEFVPDAAERNAYHIRTIWDAPQYAEAEKFEFLKLDYDEVQRISAERNYTPEQRMEWLRQGCPLDNIGDEYLVAPRQRRELLCIRVREATSVVVPEFDRRKHVKEFEMPDYGHAYVSIDPGVKDLCAVNFCVWDFANYRLLIVDEWTKRNANTNEIVSVLQQKEVELWSQLQFWNGKGLSANPYMRVSDVDTRMITDMQQLHGINVIPARKDDAEAALHALRNAFQQGRIVVHPRCVNTIEHLEGAVWNKGRTDYQRSERLGHADHLDSLKYVWRHVNKSQNPFPPHAFHVLRQASENARVVHKPENLKTDFRLRNALNSIFAGRRKR